MKSLSVIVAAIVCTGCASTPKQHHFVVDSCQPVVLASVDSKDCPDKIVPWRRAKSTRCRVLDQVSGCAVGAIRVPNPNYANPSNDWDKPIYLYERLYDWRCPPGVSAPAAADFRFVRNLESPVACDPQTPLPPALVKQMSGTAR